MLTAVSLLFARNIDVAGPNRSFHVYQEHTQAEFGYGRSIPRTFSAVQVAAVAEVHPEPQEVPSMS